jgi:sigma-E factor negative regulatory protein RseB
MESALPLRSDLLDNSGKPISQIMFTNIKIGHMIVDNSLELVTQEELKEYQWKHQNPAQDMANSTNESKWVFDSVPDGFRLSVHESREGANSSLVEHFVFSDGFATLSVYIEKALEEKKFEGESQMGAIHAYGAQSDGFQITAVGEVPAQTVKKFALSAKLQQE